MGEKRIEVLSAYKLIRSGNTNVPSASEAAPGQRHGTKRESTVHHYPEAKA